MESVHKKIKKNQALGKEFPFHNMCKVRNGNVLKSRVVEICGKCIRINQGVGVVLYCLKETGTQKAKYSRKESVP